MKTEPLPGQMALFADLETLSIQAAAEPTTLRAASVAVDIQAAAGEGKRPTFSIVGYTGAPMVVAGFFSPVIVDLSGLRVPGQVIPALRGHDDDRIVGQTDSVKIGSTVDLTGIITGENEDAREVTSQAKNGFQWQASIGADILRREFLEAGKTATVNGREVAGPMILVRESVLKEISFVALGADGNTSASVAASSPGSLTGAPTMFEQWLQAKGFDPAALSDSQKAALKAAYDAEQTPPPKPKADEPPKPTQTLEEIVAARRAEDNRIAEITKIAGEWIDRRPMMLDEIQAMATAAIEARGTTPDQFTLMLIRDTRVMSAPSAIVRGSDRRTSSKVVEASLCRAGGLKSLEKHFDDKTLNLSDDRFPNGLGLKDLFLMFARENGYSSPTTNEWRPILRAAFAEGPSRVQATGFSTNSLSGILGATANKFLAQGFDAVESTWRDIASIGSVQDFKTITRYALTGDFIYEKLGPAGEMKHATAGELSYTNRAETYAKMFAITRQDLINDDLGALTAVPRRLGRGAGLKLNDVFWTVFLAGVGSFWTAGNNNLITGATTVLGDTGLTLASTEFRQQTDPDGRPTAITPRILLVPPELEITAAQLMTSTTVNTGGAATDTRVPNANVWSMKYKVVPSVYLSNSSYTGYSTTAWYLLADPNDLSTIEVVFLNGKDTPTVESADADFDQLGVQFRGFHDFGASLVEKRASVRSAGA